MFCEVVQPERLRIFDQDAENPMTSRQGADLGDRLLIDPDRDELGQCVAVADDTERGVPGVDEFRGRFHDSLQHRLQVESAADGHDGVQQAMQPIARGENCLQA